MNMPRESVHVYTPAPDTLHQYLIKVWRHRELIRTFAERDLRTRYAQTYLGFGWALVQPLTALAIFTFFFGFILSWQGDGMPYPLHVLSGLLIWNFFTYVVFQGSQSIQESGQLIRKIYFPKAVLPLSKVLTGLVELGISTLLLIPLMLWYGEAPSWRLLLFPAVVLLTATLALALVFLVTALAFRRRDLHHIIPFLMYFGIWTAPVFFTKDLLPAEYQFLWALNPVAATVEAWRFVIFPAHGFEPRFLPALLASLPLCLTGLFIFVRQEGRFSDYT
jgi:lipopolysaccharide transport system permease protein